MVNEHKAITVENLSKNFEVIEKDGGFYGSVKAILKPKKRIVRALKRINFSINRGELVGFIGPNGAGKTTTLKILSGLLYPSSGFVEVLGFNPWDRKHEYLKQISLVMGQKNQLWWDLPAIETFELNRQIYEISNNDYEEYLNEFTKLLEVTDLVKIPVRRLSLGQRMRMELVAALLHKPNVLFLDEPTIGLDVVAQQKVRDFIFEYNKRNNATVILTSHNMADLSNLTKRVIVIDGGEILFDGEFRRLTENYAKEKIIKVYLSKETDLKKFEDIGVVKKVEYPEVVLVVPREASAIAASEILQSFPVADLNIEEEPIESVIRRIFKGELPRKEKGFRLRKRLINN